MEAVGFGFIWGVEVEGVGFEDWEVVPGDGNVGH
jgi:hypothetical protein